MSKKYTYEEVMDMSEEEFSRLRERHWLASEVSSERRIISDEKMMSPWFKRELMKRGLAGGIALVCVGTVCLTVKYAVDHWND